MPTLRWFPRLASDREVQAGDYVLLLHGNERSIALRTAANEEEDLWLVLKSTHPTPVPWPGLVELDALTGVAMQIPHAEIFIEPLRDELPFDATTTDPASGALILDQDGRCWVRINERRDVMYVDLNIGQIGRPCRPNVAFKNWRLVQRLGDDARTLVEMRDSGR
jgi:hypothetical protein